MNTENPFQNSSVTLPANATPNVSVSLRWWPAAMLLVVMGLMKIIPTLVESPPLPVMMMGFMGPAGICGLILIWWLFASRAGIREKITGLIGVVGLALVSALLLHFSMKGMSTIVYQLPAGFVLFTVSLIILAGRPAYRLRTALLMSALGFGFWDLLQLKGITGRFEAEFAWRWSPTAEQQYLKSLAERKATAQDGSTNPLSASDQTPVITRADAQWPEFRGPLRDGRYPGVILDEDWTGSPPQLIWKSKIGPGWSSFAAAGNRLWTQEQRGDNEAVLCLNASNGDILWAYEYPSRFWEAVAGAGPRATPTLSDEGLFALGANGNLICLNPSSGEVLWQRDMQADAGCKPPQWGFSSSPLAVDGLVVVHAGGSGNKGILAYDAKSGDIRWTVASGNHSYSSPHLATIDGIPGILMQTNSGLQCLNIQDGTVLWQHEWPLENYRAIQPLVIGNSVLIASSLGMGTRRITVSHSADQWTTKEDWTSTDMKPDFNDFVEYDGHIYGFDGNIFACIDLTTGKRAWKKGRYGSGQVLLLSDAGQLLVAAENGELVLIKADPSKLDELARIPAIEGKTWNHPIVVDNRIFLRNSEEVACYEFALKPAQ